MIHLQEVVPETYGLITSYLPAYKVIPGNDTNESDYFSVTLTRNNSVGYEDHEIISYPGSAMGRNLLVVKVYTNLL